MLTRKAILKTMAFEASMNQFFPTTTKRGGVEMVQFEYKVWDVSENGIPRAGEGATGEQIEAGLNQLGKEGWQMCGWLPGSLIFCRKLTVERMIYHETQQKVDVYHPSA